MSSLVYYKFKSQKEPQRITIDGPHTDVWNLKREIISHAQLGDGTDFDLKIYKENSNEEYTDDTEIIPKDSTVLARRLPAAAPGKGRAARYVSGKPPVNARVTSSASRSKAVQMDSAMTEEERLKAILQMTDADWLQKQEEMSHEVRVPLQGGKPFMKKANVPEGEPPHGYICYRCGKKGHWIQACPTNDDANYDHKNRIKRTTGIPRSMLRKVDQADVEKLDETQRQNLMVNADGDYVFAQADEKAWRRHQEQAQATAAAQKNAKIGNKDLQERGLECSIDKRMFVDPMKTPCCSKTYCHDCIENALLENDLTCPGCETENVSLERLEPDEEAKAKIKEFEADKQAAKSPATAVAMESPRAGSPTGSRPQSSAGPQSPRSVNSGEQARKRAASEVDENSPLAPVMKRAKSGEDEESQTPEQNASTPDNTTSGNASNYMPPDMSSMMQGMPNMNFPMMPFMPMPGMMGMNGMNGMNMNMMPNMNFMPPNFNMMNGMFPSGAGGNFANGMGGNFQNQQFGNSGYHQGQNRYNKSFNKSQHQQGSQQPAGMSGVPTGPKALSQLPNQNHNPTSGTVNVPTGPAGSKFSNQQRQAGNDEDNAYMRLPVNPNRSRGRGRMRQAEYREL